MTAGGQVDQPLDHEHHLGAAGGTIRRGRHRVGEHRAPANERDRDVVHARQHRHTLGERDEGHAVGADVAGVDAAQREEAAVGVERQLGVGDEVAGLVVGQHRLAPVARPLHRAAETPSRPRHQRLFRIAAVAGAVVAADVARDDADGGGRHPEGAGDVALDAPRAARARVDRVAAARRVVVSEHRPRLHRHAGDPVHARLEADDVRGPRERRVGGGGVAGLGVDAEVRRRVLPHTHGVAGDGVGGRDRCRERRPLHAHALGAVAGGGRCFGDHHRDGSPTKRARSVGRGECGAMKKGEPSRLVSGTSYGLVGTGRCGIGTRPSWTASAPLRTAMTPGVFSASAPSIPRIAAWACGERTMHA